MTHSNQGAEDEITWTILPLLFRSVFFFFFFFDIPTDLRFLCFNMLNKTTDFLFLFKANERPRSRRWNTGYRQYDAYLWHNCLVLQFQCSKLHRWTIMNVEMHGEVMKFEINWNYIVISWPCFFFIQFRMIKRLSILFLQWFETTKQN